jgi:aminopeptidase C
MYDDWFTRYVFMVVVPKATLNAVEAAAIGKAPEVIKEDDWEIP